VAVKDEGIDIGKKLMKTWGRREKMMKSEKLGVDGSLLDTMDKQLNG